MDLRREKRKGDRLLGLLITLAALCAAVIIALLVSHFSKNDAEEQKISYKDIDSRAVSAAEGFSAVFDEQNSADEFSYEIKEKLVFKNSSEEGRLLLKNPSKNRYLMRLELVIDNEVVISTDNIAPGQMIKTIKLDSELSADEYDAVAYINAIDPESGDMIGTVKQPITVIVER